MRSTLRAPPPAHAAMVSCIVCLLPLLPQCPTRLPHRTLLQFADAHKLAETLREVRGADDPSSAEWCVFAYADRASLELVATGGGVVAGLLAAAGAGSELGSSRLCDTIHYVYLRLERGEGTNKETRFCLITCMPDTVPGMAKSVMVPHKGGVTAIFSPFTSHLEVESLAELTQEQVEKEAKFYVDW